MNHKEAEDKKMAELYFNQELTPEEELEFEEHLMLCDICRKNVLLLEGAKEALEELKKNEFRKKKDDPVPDRYFKKRTLLRIAAAAILLTGMTGIFYLLSDRTGRHNSVPEVAKKTEQLFPVKDQADSLMIFSERDTFSGSGSSEELIYLSESFVPDPFFENLIRQSYRNTGLTLLSPLNDTISKIPVFTWADSGIQVLNLKIINNREEVIFNKKIKNGTRPELNIPSGLYYWQLQSSEETLLTDRLILMRSAPDKGKTSP